ncbi:MAG: dihydrolipoamide acetyltransferase family protein [Candidatus Micrarchaeia archaeon]
MAYEFRLPDLGEGMEEATIVKWLVKPGDYVKKDQNIVEVETDKAIVEIPSPYEGRVLELMFKEGDVVKVGSVLITIGGEKESIVRETETKEENVQIVKEAVAPPRIRKLARELGVNISEVKGSGPHGEISEDDVRKYAKGKMAVLKELERTPEMRIVEKVLETAPHVEAVPKARELAKKLNIDLTKIAGTGPGGVITVGDVERTAERLEKIVEVKKIGKAEEVEMVLEKVEHPMKERQARLLETRIPIKGIRKTIINKLSKSNSLAVQTVAMEEVDVTKLTEVREKEKIAASRQGIKLTYLPFIIKACVIGLRKHPWLNSSIDENTNEFVLKKYYNIGIAIDTEDGLIVPVIKDVELKSILDIAHEIELLAEKARQRKLTFDEVKGGTFTITNWGSIGGTFGTPILNYPECAILGVGRIEKKPWVVGDKIEIRHILPLSLTFDHRIVDGAQAARFLVDIKRYLEDPTHLLVDIV